MEDREKTLESIGNVLRMSSQRITKIAVLGWLGSLEEVQKRPGKKRKHSSIGGNFLKMQALTEPRREPLLKTVKSGKKL